MIALTSVLMSVFAKCRTLAHYAECRHAECRYAECRCASLNSF
jgi:hypothetical protein